MGEVSTIGLDIAKSVFQVHGVDADGAVVIRKRISRAKVLEFFAALPSCLVGIEACPSAHHWSRKLQALGHTVRLMPPSYVKAYLKRSKNDANDAAAICEAVTRPSMRFVPTKSEQQQSGLMLHRGRQLLVRQRTMLNLKDDVAITKTRWLRKFDTSKYVRSEIPRDPNEKPNTDYRCPSKDAKRS
jgi:transposase